MAVNCGIIGLPNVGKSTIFSAISNAQAEAANYPFCTIEPNKGIVFVPDKRLHNIQSYIPTQKVIPTTIEFVDIAGLVAGASRGEGLGNKFLSHIREVGVLIHVVRCFEDSDIIHVENRIDPVSDIEIINLELCLADLETVQKRLLRLQKEKRDMQLRKSLEQTEALLLAVQDTLSAGKLIHSLNLSTADLALIQDLHLITSKPMLYVCNVDEDTINKENKYVNMVFEYAQQHNMRCISMCGQLEKEIASIDNEDERTEFLHASGITSSGLEIMIQEGYSLLNLVTYFTAGEKEIRAWTFSRGATAPECAGIIHTDFIKGFIRAEIYTYDDLMKYQSELKIKEAGKLRLEGKNYHVCDGDIVYFRVNT